MSGVPRVDLDAARPGGAAREGVAVRNREGFARQKFSKKFCKVLPDRRLLRGLKESPSVRRRKGHRRKPVLTVSSLLLGAGTSFPASSHMREARGRPISNERLCIHWQFWGACDRRKAIVEKARGMYIVP